MNIRRPVIRYFGGKFRLGPWIISHFPPHVTFCEGLCGACSITLLKEPSRLEVCNDLDGEVINFFTILRTQTTAFIRAIELTPFARAELEQAFQPTTDPFERARRFYIRSWQARGGPRAHWRTGWRFQRSNYRGKRSVDDWRDVGHLEEIVERLREVQFECDDVLRVIPRFDTPQTLFYLDPPYVPSTRSERWSGRAYAYEMTEADHRKLRDALENIRGMAIVSGYPSELYEELYAGWDRSTKETQTDASTTATECLWISPNAARAVMPLFEMCEREV